MNNTHCHSRYARAMTLAVGSASFMAGGCAVGPDYHAPTPVMPAHFAEENPGASSVSTQPSTQPAAATQESAASEIPPQDVAEWWKNFNDPTLNSLMRRAIRANLDLQLAQARILEARASLQGNRANELPTVDAVGSYTRERFSRGTSTSSGFTSTGSGTGTTGTTTTGTVGGVKRDLNLFDTGFDASWEIDVFGGVRRSIESGKASVQTEYLNLQTALITLTSEVGVNYVTLRSAQQQLNIAKQNAAAQNDSLNLTRTRLKAGLNSDLDVARAEAQLYTTEATIPPLETTLRTSIHALSILLDREPGALLRELTPDGPIPVTPPVVPVGLPSELLRRRPDVRAAERALAAQTANIGVAVADLYPRFALNGNLGFSAAQAKDWFNQSSFFYQFGPSMTWNIFDFGKVRANINLQKARTVEQFITYEQTVLRAMQESEDSLITYTREHSRRGKLAQAVGASQRSVNLSLELYRRGLDTFLDVLTAQQSLYTTQLELADSDRLLATDLISLYKSLGGGWDASQKFDTKQDLKTPFDVR